MLVVYVQLIKHYTKHFFAAKLATLVKIKEFSCAEQRNRASILRLKNVYFQHPILLKLHALSKPKSIIFHTFYGLHDHRLIKRVTDGPCMVSGRTLNTEKKKVTFKLNQVPTSLPSNHHFNGVITNALIPLQSNDALNENHTTPERE